MTDGERRWYALPGPAALVLIAAALTARPSAAQACSVCGCGDPLLAASDPAAIAGILRLQLDTEHLAMTAGTDERTGYVDHLSQWAYRLNLVYRPTSLLSFVATLPLLDKTIRTVGGGTNDLASHLSGLGDVELAARYAAWHTIDYSRRRVQELALSLGSAMPTGAYDAQTSDLGGAIVPVDPHGQIGTGAWGPFAGLHYRFEQGDWLGFADFSYRLRTTATYFDHSTYKFGDALLGGVHAQYRPLASLVVDLGMDGRHALVDRAAPPGGGGPSTVANTGGSVLAIAPGVYFNALGSLWLFARAQVPFSENLRGQQDVGLTAAAGLQYEIL